MLLVKGRLQIHEIRCTTTVDCEQIDIMAYLNSAMRNDGEPMSLLAAATRKETLLQAEACNPYERLPLSLSFQLWTVLFEQHYLCVRLHRLELLQPSIKSSLLQGGSTDCFMLVQSPVCLTADRRQKANKVMRR